MREDLLHALLTLSRPLEKVSLSLLRYPWQSKKKLATVSRAHVASALRRYVNRGLTADDLEEWANAVEGQAEIALEPGYEALLKEALSLLASPGPDPITPRTAAKLVYRLETGRDFARQ